MEQQSHRKTTSTTNELPLAFYFRVWDFPDSFKIAILIKTAAAHN